MSVNTEFMLNLVMDNRCQNLLTTLVKIFVTHIQKKYLR